MDSKTKRYKEQQKPFIRSGEAGNTIVMLFGAIAMAGVITFGLNNIMRGPASTAAEAGRRTIAENNLVASAQLAVKAATSAQANEGDCDGDGFVEPMPWREAGVLPKPTGGGLIPLTMGASITDPWGTQYGYCVWDQGTATVSDNVAACGGNTANRLAGAKRDDQPALAVISAGKNGAFETTCSAYVDTTPADGEPDTALIVKAGGSDDIVLSYTYAEANGIGGGEWKLKDGDDTTAEISKNIEVDGGADFTDGPLELTDKGLVLPGDPGDNTITGICDEAKDQQIRRNTVDSPPTLEICDFANGNGWTPISGGGGAGNVFNIDVPNCTENRGGPFVEEEIIAMSGDPGTPVSDGRYVYVPRNSDGLDVFRVDDYGVTFMDNDMAPLPAVGGVWSDGNYVYYGHWWSDDLKVSTFDGTQMQSVDYEGISASGFAGVVGQGEDVFVGSYGPGVKHVKMVANDIVSTPYATGYNNNIVAGYKDGYLFTVGESGGTNYLLAFEFTGSALNYINRVSYTGTFKGFAKDATDYVYIATTDYLNAYAFDGTAFTLAGTLNGGTRGVYSDGVNVFAGRDPQWWDGAAKLEAYQFDGSAFNLIQSFSLTLPDMGSISGDGNKLYVTGTSADDLTILSGYGCTSHTTIGGSSGDEESVPATYRTDPLDEDLVGHWKMDEGSGNIAKDSVGDSDAVFQNSPEWTNGPHGLSGLSFTSANSDALIIPTLFDSPTKGTISVLVNAEIPEGSTSDYFVFGLGPNFYLYLGKDKVKARYNTGGGSYFEVLNADYPLSGWHHIVYTFDTTTEHVIYVDGQKVTSNLSSYYSYAKEWSLIESYVGKKSDSTSYFNGGLDDVRVYNRVLSPAEVLKLSQKILSESKISDANRYTVSVDTTKSKLSAGSYTGCMIKSDGSPWCWGDDTSDVLGNAATASQTSPIRVETPTVDPYYLTSTNSDQAPASNAFSKKLLMLPPVSGTTGTTAVSFTAGQSKDGYGFTEPSVPGIDDGLGPRTYSVVVSHTAQACVDTKVYIARVNSAGTVQTEVQLGDAQNMATLTTHTYTGNADLGTFATTDRIRVRYNMQNICTSAPSMTMNYNTASIMYVPLKTPLSWTQISGFISHTCGVRADGTAWCWGDDTNTALGNGTITGTQTTPSLVYNTGAPWSKISIGNHFGCGIKSDGTLWCWGAGSNGRLANGATSGYQNVPGQVGAGTDWVDISAGNQHACGLKTDGSAWCWGNDTNAQLGNGSTSGDQSTPVQVQGYGRWVRIAAGGGISCGIKEDGSAWCWGTDSNGMLGNGPVLTAAQDVPSRVMGQGRWADISVNRGQHACGLKTDGSLWCWGTGTNGRLGINSTSNQSVPRRVPGIDRWIAVSVGYIHTCAMKADYSVWCWGDDTSGALGNGASLTGDKLVPTLVPKSINDVSWSWNDAASIIMGPYSTNIALGSSFLSDAAYMRGFGFTAAGKAVFRQTADSSQLAIETTANNASSQLTMKTATTSGAAEPTPGPVAKWTLDYDSNGPTTAYASVGGAALHGTVVGGALWLSTSASKIGTALTFDGADDGVTVARHATLEPSAITLSVWFKMPIVPIANSVAENLLAKYDSTNASGAYVSYILGFPAGSGYPQFTTGHSGSYDSLTASQFIRPNTWTHLVASYDPGGSAPQKKIYINGVLSASSTLTSALAYDTSVSGTFHMGAFGPTFFKGEMDDVRIYDRQLTDAEVLALYGAQNSASQIARTLGIDYGTSNFEIARNAAGTDWLNTLTPDLVIDANGNVGVGTATPASKMDISGGIQIGSENYCGTGRAGTLRYIGASPFWQYCDGTSWNSFNTPTTYWRTDYNSWSAAGGSYGTGGCAIATTGIAYCWGKNDKNRVGDNTTTNAESPVAVHSSSSSTPWSDWKSISTSEGRSCGIRSDGTAWCWGSSYLGHNSNWWQGRPVQVLNNSGGAGWADWKQISVGDTTTCGIRTDGTAWCWNEAVGNNTTNAYAVPEQVHSDSSSTGWTDWVFIDSGYGTSCGIRSNGTAWCWARWNWPNAMTGNNSTADHLRPVQVHSDSSDTGWTDWKQLDVGSHNVCGLRYNGTVWCWGNNGDCVTGNAACGGTAMRPTQVQTDTGPGAWSDWVQVTTMCGVRANGTAWCWGPSSYGRIGYNYDGWWSSGRPAQVHSDTSDTGWTDWVGVKALRNANCGMRANGTLWCWGADWDGQLGNGSALTANQLRPSQVANP